MPVAMQASGRRGESRSGGASSTAPSDPSEAAARRRPGRVDGGVPVWVRRWCLAGVTIMRGMLLCDAAADGCGLVCYNVCLICRRGCLVVTRDSCNMTRVLILEGG